MRHKILRSFLVVALLASNTFAQQPVRTINSAPDAERLRTHVTYLASDKLDGRRTGTAGAEAAAQYIAEEFKRLGLRPVVRQSNAPSQGKEEKSGATFSTYAQAFPYVAGVELGEGNAMSFSPRASDTAAGAKQASLDLRLREDWMPLGFSGNGRVDKAPVVFVGYGIKAGELNHDDYAGGDVANRVVAAFAGTPDGDNPHGKFALYGDLRLKAAAARGAGAKALVIIATEDNFKDDKLARLAYNNAGGGDAGLPVIVVSRQFAAQASGRSLTDLREFEKEMRATAAAAPRFTPDATLSIAVNVVRVERPAHNVVGILEGSDPQLKNEAIIIGAHYDHLGRGGQGSLAAREGEIHHGADD
ncbi:MAG: M28 family peptidase, partial [Acidobacteriota bacterium]|nr:M28 family peptidase [Acidobacteriota bacterium]